MRSADPNALNIGIKEMLAKVGGVVPEVLAYHKIRDQPLDGLNEKYEVGAPTRLFAAAPFQRSRQKSCRRPKAFLATGRLCLQETVANNVRAVDWTPPAIARRLVDAAA